MKLVDTILKKHALVAYTMLCFLLSWGSVIFCVGLSGFPARPDEAEETLPVIVAATVLGPSISGLVLSLAKYGMNGTKQNLRDRYRWKNYFVVLSFFAPAVVGVVLGVFCALVSTELYIPAILTIEKEKRISFVSEGIAYGIAAGIFEELGWSFFAVPEMLIRGKSVLNTGITVGLVWGIWHFLVAIWGSGNADGTFSVDLFIPWIPWNLLVLPAYRVLMVNVFEATDRSVWAMILMHGTLTSSLPPLLMPSKATGLALASFYTYFALTLEFITVFYAWCGCIRRIRPGRLDGVAEKIE